MKTLAQRITLLLAGTALITSCSRPYATVQRTPTEHFVSAAPARTVQSVAPAEAEAPVVVTAPVETPALVTPAPAPEVASVQAQLNEAVASNKTVMADKRVQKQLTKINAALAASTQQASMAPASQTTAKKMNLMERMMVKKIDKKIKQQMYPQKTMAKSLLTLGAIIAVIGLILVLIGTGGLATLGYIALLVGLVLILVDLIR